MSTSLRVRHYLAVNREFRSTMVNDTSLTPHVCELLSARKLPPTKTISQTWPNDRSQTMSWSWQQTTMQVWRHPGESQTGPEC